MSLQECIPLESPDSPEPANAALPPWRETLLYAQAGLWQQVRAAGPQARVELSPRASCVLSDALQWLAMLPAESIHAVVTDPPYGLIEYEDKDHAKLRAGRGGVWRIPPSFDGARRQPLPRFTVLGKADVASLCAFFTAFATDLLRVLVPGGHVFMAANPLLSSLAFTAHGRSLPGGMEATDGRPGTASGAAHGRPGAGQPPLHGGDLLGRRRALPGRWAGPGAGLPGNDWLW